MTSNGTQMSTEPPASPQERPKAQPSLKDRVERNPFIYIISCVIAAVGVSAGVQQYFYSQQTSEYQRKADDLSAKLASIHRGLPGSEYLDVRQLVYAKNNSSTEIPAGSKYFADGSFYASTAKDWQYSITTEKQLLQDFTGISFSQSSPVEGALTLAPVYLWKPKGKPISVEGAPPFRQVYPYIILQDVSFEQLHQLVGLAAKNETTDAPATEDKASAAAAADKDKKDKDDTFRNIDKYLQNDAVGSVFTMKLFTMMISALESPKESFTLLDIQRVGNVLYTRVLFTMRDLKVGGKHYDKYYMRQEIILIATPGGISLIQTLTPSEDPAFRNAASTAITTWLNDFRVVVG